jgi:hypothetical protein
LQELVGAQLSIDGLDVFVKFVIFKTLSFYELLIHAFIAASEIATHREATFHAPTPFLSAVLHVG